MLSHGRGRWRPRQAARRRRRPIRTVPATTSAATPASKASRGEGPEGVDEATGTGSTATGSTATGSTAAGAAGNAPESAATNGSRPSSTGSTGGLTGPGQYYARCSAVSGTTVGNCWRPPFALIVPTRYGANQPCTPITVNGPSLGSTTDTA
jgi:hypothetical protein